KPGLCAGFFVARSRPEPDGFHKSRGRQAEHTARPASSTGGSMPTPHQINILIHVTAGSIALLIGLLILALRKGDARHRALGRTAVTFAGLSVAAALVGALVWRGRLDLMGVSVLVTYQIWSGLRSLRLRDGGRRAIDALPALGVLGLGVL